MLNSKIGNHLLLKKKKVGNHLLKPSGIITSYKLPGISAHLIWTEQNIDGKLIPPIIQERNEILQQK